ncbi:MAG: hypothetical protein IJT65_06595 [Eubacterium sp.]|nr:hypothetical protein [Eubacterium sp.]
MKKALSLFLAVIMLLSIAPSTAFAATAKTTTGTNATGLAYTKTTENYDGYRFVKGTKAVWDCSDYTLTATVTAVSGSKATFNVGFKNKAAKTYEIKYVANDNFDTCDSTEAINFTVDTTKPDILSTSSVCGSQFVKLVVINGTNEDTYGLTYYISPTYRINSNSLVVTKNSFTLGTYAFESIVQYRVKGTSAWSKKAFAKNSKMYLGGLKAGTTYEVLPLCKMYYTDIETNQRMYVIDAVCKTITLTTSLTVKPKVTSIKVTGIKYGKKTIPAHWEDHANQPSVWRKTEKLNTANYKVTVKVKSVPKKAKGLVMTIGGTSYYAKGNKKSYTFNLTYQDHKKIKGKKMTAKFAYSSNTNGKSPLGKGPAKTAKYKIKKGTYKVK